MKLNEVKGGDVDQEDSWGPRGAMRDIKAIVAHEIRWVQVKAA